MKQRLANIDLHPSTMLRWARLRATPSVLHSEVEAAGYCDVITHSISGDTMFETAEKFWKDITRGTAPIAIMKAKMPSDDWEKKSRSAIQYVETRAGPFPTKLGATAHLCIAKKPQ